MRINNSTSGNAKNIENYESLFSDTETETRNSSANAQDALTATQMLTTSEIALWWGCTRQNVQKLTTDAVLRRSDAGLYDLQESTRAYLQYLRASAKLRNGNADPGIKLEKLRIAKEQADKLSLANAKERGELLSVTDVRSEWSNILSTVKSAMLAIPSRLSELDTPTLEKIEREIRSALEALADG